MFVDLVLLLQDVTIIISVTITLFLLDLVNKNQSLVLVKPVKHQLVMQLGTVELEHVIMPL